MAPAFWRTVAPPIAAPTPQFIGATMGVLYQLLFPNGKSYIGITYKDAATRFEEHCNFAKRGITKCNRKGPILWPAIRKYGKDEIICNVLHHSDNWEELCKLEQEAIISYNSLAPNGYNLTSGGEGQRRPVSNETKLKISLSVKATTNTEEFKKRQSEITKAAMTRPEVRAKVMAGISKLKDARPKKQIRTTRKLASNNTSGYIGVYLDKRTGRYFAKITISGVVYNLGYHATAHQAHLIRKQLGETHE